MRAGSSSRASSPSRSASEARSWRRARRATPSTSIVSGDSTSAQAQGGRRRGLGRDARPGRRLRRDGAARRDTADRDRPGEQPRRRAQARRDRLPGARSAEARDQGSFRARGRARPPALPLPPLVGPLSHPRRKRSTSSSTLWSASRSTRERSSSGRASARTGCTSSRAGGCGSSGETEEARPGRHRLQAARRLLRGALAAPRQRRPRTSRRSLRRRCSRSARATSGGSPSGTRRSARVFEEQIASVRLQVRRPRPARLRRGAPAGRCGRCRRTSAWSRSTRFARARRTARRRPRSGPAKTPEPPRERIRSFPHVWQIDEMDCGAACLAMVCRHFGRAVSLPHIRKAVHMGVDGTSLTGIAAGAEAVGLRVRSVKASKTRLDELAAPGRLPLRRQPLGRALRRGRPTRAPGRPGARRRPHEARGVRGEVVGLRGAPRLRAAARGGAARRDKGALALAVLPPVLRARSPSPRSWPCVAAGLQMALPVFTEVIVDRLVADRTLDRACSTCSCSRMSGVLVLMIAANLIQRYILSRAAVTLDRRTLDFLTAKLLALPDELLQLPPDGRHPAPPRPACARCGRRWSSRESAGADVGRRTFVVALATDGRLRLAARRSSSWRRCRSTPG